MVGLLYVVFFAGLRDAMLPGGAAMIIVAMRQRPNLL